MIAILDSSVIDKIAAGEVVDRPASVVKELMENAIDASATVITVEISGGGIDLIRVTDNGSGIAREEVETAFLRHATSKIRTDADLQRLHSLGFRGEALSSISAVTRLEMISKPREQLVGTRYCIEGGVSVSLEEVGAPDGTTIIARDLFYNTPVRKKFLKSAQTEGAYIADYVEKLALAHADISIRFIQNNQTRIHTLGSGKLKDVIYSLYGRDAAQALLEVEYQKNGICIEGYIAKPEYSRGNRNMENYYVNSRLIKDKSIAAAIEEGFGNRLMQHQYPFTALQFTIDPQIVDVNVHPAKLQVRFSDPALIYEATREAVQKTLLGKELIRTVTLDGEEKDRRKQNTFFLAGSSIQGSIPNTAGREKGIGSDSPSGGGSSFQDIAGRGAADFRKAAPAVYANAQSISENAEALRKKEEVPLSHEQKAPESFEQKRNADYMERLRQEQKISEQQGDYRYEQMRLLDTDNKAKHRIVGQVFDTYWILEFDQSMYLIDQHAAHEKVWYEELLARVQNAQMTSQQLMPPMIMSLTAPELQCVEEYREYLESMGYHIEGFGGREIKISAIPSILPSISKIEVLKEIIGELSAQEMPKAPELILSKIASMSCKAAVKGNDHLSIGEAQKLVDALFALENPYSCPHGRPTIIKMTKQELEKKFKRIV